MIEVENTDVNIVRNLIPMRNHMPASAYGLKAISDWFSQILRFLAQILRFLVQILRFALFCVILRILRLLVRPQSCY